MRIDAFSNAIERVFWRVESQELQQLELWSKNAINYYK